MADYYVNDAVRKMYGIPLSQLTPEQRRILREDGKRRAKLIEERQKDVMQNNRKAFDNAEKMNRVLSSIYESCQKSILADVAATQAKVKKAGGEWSYANQSALTRSRGLFEQINNELVKLGKKENEYFRKNLTNIYTDQFLRATYTLGQTQTVKGNFNMLNPRLIEAALDYPWSGAMFSDRLWLDKDRLGRNLRIGLTQSMILGEDMDRIADRIQANIDTSRYNAMRIARTETKRVCYVSQVEAWKSQGVSEVRYMAANGGDSRSCNLCKADNGKKYKLGEEPTLPRHPNCRCWYNPVTPDTFGDNELNELTGSIRGAENYDKWKQEYEVALNPDGSYKPGWKRESWKDGGRVMYTAADGKKYTLQEYKEALKDGNFSEDGVYKKSVSKKVSQIEEKYNEELNKLDNDYKAKNLEITSMRDEQDKLESQSRGYATIRRGLLDPEECGFKDRVEFEKVDKALSNQIQELRKKLDEAQSALKDIITDREYLLKVGAEKVDSLEDYRFIRNALRKNRTFDYSTQGDELMEAISKMDVKDISLQREFFANSASVDWRGISPLKVFNDGAISDVRILAQTSGVSYNKVEKLKKILTDDEIIDKLAGGDMTTGSCASLGFAYAANRGGWDVTDFRGGKSQEFFASYPHIKQVMKLPGIKGQIVKVKKEASDTAKFIKTLEIGKEFYLAVGRHAAIIKNTENGVMYLELQSGVKNGWMPFTKYGNTSDTLYKRFGCRKTARKLAGTTWESEAVLIEVDSFKNSEEFSKLMGYINTATDKQKKGASGSVK